MKTLSFSTDLLAPEDRLPAFRKGAVDFVADALGDPHDFSARWRLLKFGDLNGVHAFVSPIHHRRDRAMIEADGVDRVAIHYILGGLSEGELDGRPARAVPGAGSVWDLAHTIDMRTAGTVEILILTLPRHMLAEVLPAASYAAALPAAPALTMAADQLLYMMDHSADLPDEGAPFFGRALRDLFAVAMLPTLAPSDGADDAAAGPLFRRICDLLDAAPEREFDEAALAAALDAPAAEVARIAEHVGGLPLLVERRRLLSAYRLLGDQDEAASVSVIAQRCGFTDLSRFSRRFREVFEASPSELRTYRRGSLPRWAGAYHVETNYGAMMAS